METSDGGASAVSIAERVLSAAWGSTVRLGAVERLGGSGRSRVSRLRVVEAPADAPATVIVKQATVSEDETYAPAAATAGPAWRLFNDWAGLRFLSEVSGEAAVAPRLYAGDRGAGVIVLEDIEASAGLHQVLLGTDPVAAENALMLFATTLGRMHARTIGKHQHYSHLRQALGPALDVPVSTAAESSLTPQELATAFRSAAEALTISPQQGMDAELAAVAALWWHPDPAFLAYTHQDPCPDNALCADGAVRLVDFEFGAFHHALLDGVYGRILFPSCWCVNRLPPHVPLRMEAVYRAELVTGCPEAAEDRLFYRAVVEACAYWVIGMLSGAMPGLLKEDQGWGISTVRQRVLLRLDILAQTTKEFDHLTAIGATAGSMRDKLGNLWSSEVEAMPYYPAFR